MSTSLIRLSGTTLALALLLARAAAAQDERWQVTLDDERYVWDIRLVELDGNALVIRQADSLVRLPVAHVNEIRLIRKTDVHVGGGAEGSETMSALVGGNDEVYDVSTLDLPARLRTIRKIFQVHPTGP
jgi:hypothetical protein